jgi:hypothetical protein
MHQGNAVAADFGRVGVMRVSGEYRLLAAESLPADSYLFPIDGQLTSRPSRYSVQIDQEIHVDLGAGHSLEEEFDRFYWRFMNHSCEPNAVIRRRAVFALKPIRVGEQIAFDYNTTEYELAEPFECRCGSSRCDGLIRGFRFLARREQERLRPWLADHLLLFLDGDGSTVNSGLAAERVGSFVHG